MYTYIVIYMHVYIYIYIYRFAALVCSCFFVLIDEPSMLINAGRPCGKKVVILFRP